MRETKTIAIANNEHTVEKVTYSSLNPYGTGIVAYSVLESGNIVAERPAQIPQKLLRNLANSLASEGLGSPALAMITQHYCGV